MRTYFPSVRGLVALCSLLALLALSACGGPPATSEMESLLERELNGAAEEPWLELEGFQKRDGVEESDSVYVCEVEYDLVYLKSSKDVAHLRHQDAKREKNPLAVLAAAASAVTQTFRHGTFEAGDKVHRKHAVRFEKWDEGWRIAGN